MRHIKSVFAATLVFLLGCLIWQTPAYAAMGLDGSSENTNSSTTALSATLSTVHAGDIIFVFVVENGGPGTAVIDTAGLTFTKVGSSLPLGSPFYEELYWAYAPSALSGDTVQAFQSTSAYFSISVFGVSSTVGFNSTNPFDSNGSLPGIQTVNNTPVVISTTKASTFIISGYRDNTASPTAGSGFTQINNPASASYHLTQYMIASSPLSSYSVPIGTGAGLQNGGVATALVDNTSPPAGTHSLMLHGIP